MKKVLFVLLLSPVLYGDFNLMAQSWVIGGNNLAATGTFGSNTNFSVIFKTNNTERGRLTNAGLWGIGTGSPNSKLHVNSAAGVNALRAQVDSVTKFLVHSGGGVSIGSNTTPPANGLFVSGNTGIGTSAPENKLHVFKGSAGSVTGYVDAPVIVENSTHSYINILAPSASETGILFGDPFSNVSGGIIYNNAATLGGLQFRTDVNTTQMVLTTPLGHLGLGTIDPGLYKMKISHFYRGLDIEDAETGHDWELLTNDYLQLYFNESIRGAFNSTSGAYFSVSDERLKTNIKPMTTMLDKINQLKPSTYQFKNTTDKQEYNGFIAQDVLKVFPAMVTHNVNKERNLDVYTMDYSGFGVIAVKGIQELQPIIDEQKINILALEDRVAKLEAALADVIAGKGLQNVDAVKDASLEQNQPNPFDKSTTIRYRLPQGTNGQIKIFNQTGNLVKTLIANKSGQSKINGYELIAGTYTYTLMVNGKIAGSKKLIILK